jgi:RNA polymerase sigma-70 factor (ECF subfamily)
MSEREEMNSSDVQALRAGVGDVRDDDADLVRRVKAGDMAAFEVLYRKYQRPIFSFVARMASPEDALDVTQEAFYLAMRGIGTFQPGRRFSTWLFAIAKNRCYDLMRRRGRMHTEEYDEAQRPHADSGAADPERSALRDELCRAVDRCLHELSPEDRAVLVLRDYQQLSHEEMSEILGASIPSVKSKIHRARKRFKDKFRKYRDLLGDVEGIS